MCDFGILSIVGTVVSAAGALVQGQQAAEMGKAQQAAYDQQADNEAKASAFEASREAEKQRRLQAASIAAVGKEGVGLSGSPLEVIASNAREGQLDIDAIKYSSQLKQNQLRDQGAIARFSGNQARTASYFNAGKAAISGLTNLYDPARATRVGANPFG